MCYDETENPLPYKKAGDFCQESVSALNAAETESKCHYFADVQ